jgi:hypothetical protein
MRNLLTVSEGWRYRLPALVLAAVWAGAAIAHHSFAHIYDSGKTLTLTGTVREFQFIHPHPFLVVEVSGAGAKPRTWRAEMDNRWELEDIGVTRGTFQPGDQIVISGNPGRDQSATLYMWQLERPADRLRYRQIGGTPSLDTVPEGQAK